MLERVHIQGINLPRLYIARNKADVELAESKGIPYIKWRNSTDELLKLMLVPTLKKMFPHIRWNDVLDIPRSRSIIVHTPGRSLDDDGVLDDDFVAGTDHDTSSEENRDVTPTPHSDEDVDEKKVVVSIGDDYREFDNAPSASYEKVDLREHIGDLSSQVDLDVLQNLRLMPKFMGDITDCIRNNVVAGMSWSEGYNKKHGATIGNYDRSRELRNLIILDVSASIPVGISATMITLVDTLRSQVHADLIVTGGCSRYYPFEEELPSPQVIRDTIPRAQEAKEFYAILRDHVAGNHYGHVISFGDWDCPKIFLKWQPNLKEAIMSGTVVEQVHHYHTMEHKRTGYAMWCHELQKQPIETIDTSWCKVID